MDLVSIARPAPNITAACLPYDISRYPGQDIFIQMAGQVEGIRYNDVGSSCSFVSAIASHCVSHLPHSSSNPVFECMNNSRQIACGPYVMNRGFIEGARERRHERGWRDGYAWIPSEKDSRMLTSTVPM